MLNGVWYRHLLLWLSAINTNTNSIVRFLLSLQLIPLEGKSLLDRWGSLGNEKGKTNRYRSLHFPQPITPSTFSTDLMLE